MQVIKDSHEKSVGAYKQLVVDQIKINKQASSLFSEIDNKGNVGGRCCNLM